MKKILIVDDEEDLRVVLTFRLESAGFEVITAHNGMEALKVAKKESPDLVLLDVMMPFIDGYEVCEILKSGQDTEKIPIIILTAKKTVGDMDHAFRVGADDFMSKPYDSGELINKIKKFLQE